MSIFDACDHCDDLFQTGDAYSAEEKLTAKFIINDVVWIIMATVPQLVFASFLRMLFREGAF